MKEAETNKSVARLRATLCEPARAWAGSGSFLSFTPGSIQANAGRQSYPFHLVPDPKFKVYRRYGVETSWLGFFLTMALPSFYVDWLRSMRYGFWGGVDWQMGKMPADFLIGPDGMIVKAHSGSNFGDHLPMGEIESALHDLAS